MSGQSSTVVGAIVAVLIIGAVATLGYYQFEVAPGLNTTPSTSSTNTAVSCTKANCAFVNITSGAGSCVTASNPCGFSPLKITVVMGVNNTVFWTSNDASVHTVTGTGWGSASNPGLVLGDTYQYTFTAPGTYSYHCIYHPGMIAQVIVKAA